MSDTKNLKMTVDVWMTEEQPIKVYAQKSGTAEGGARVIRLGTIPYHVSIFCGHSDAILWRLKKEIEAHFEGATKPETVVEVSDVKV